MPSPAQDYEDDETDGDVDGDGDEGRAELGQRWSFAAAVGCERAAAIGILAGGTDSGIFVGVLDK